MTIIPTKTGTNAFFEAFSASRGDATRATAARPPHVTQPEAAFAATFHDPSTGT